MMPALKAIALLLSASTAVAAELPLVAPEKHLGVGSCSSVQCHGSILRVDEVGRSPLLNEYRTWSRFDRHAGAFEVLGGARSAAIVANLGLGDARTAPLCLDCHADNVPKERRGAKFQISDGVGCEGCHGGSERWIATHAAGAAHADNLSRGMYPTEDLARRADLCMSCHLGSERRPLSHRLMAAGHPRTSFELDTFTQIEPAHFAPGDAYRKRKPVSSSAAAWGLGQVAALEHYTAWLADERRSRDGAWPEFAQYDCVGCHHAMGVQPLTPASTPGLRPGLPRLDEVRFSLAREILRAAGSPAGDKLGGDLAALNRSLEGSGEPSQAAAAAHARVAASLAVLRKWDPSPQEVESLLARLVAADSAESYRTYASAEQLTMAVQSLLATLAKTGAAENRRAALQKALTGLFQATDSEASFRPEAFVAAVARMRSALH